MNLKELLSKMTLEQKIGQLMQINANFIVNTNANNTGAVNELGLSQEQVDLVGSILNFSCAQEVIDIQNKHLEKDPNKIPLSFMMDVIHGYKTQFPIPLALGCSFDPELVEECAKQAAKEAVTAGVMVTFSPMVDLARDARWGRVMETTSEDPYFNGEMGKAFIRGYHKGGLGVCVKHFAGYGGAEAGRDYNLVDMSEYTFRNYYLHAYKECMKENPEMYMTSFNLLNGIPSSGNKWLMNDILRGEFGFDGVLISDYNAIMEMLTHGFFANAKECAEGALNCNVDIEMMSASYVNHAKQLVEEGKISIELIDKMVMRNLKLKERLGLFTNPYGRADSEKEKKLVSKKTRLLAMETAQKCCVLLKNDGVLPLNKQEKIAYVGPFADSNEIIGFWCCAGKNEDAITIKQGVQKLVGKRKNTFTKGCGFGLFESDESGFAEAIKACKRADKIVLCIGEWQNHSGEGNSKADIRLTAIQRKLFDRLAKLNKPMVSVVFGGRPQVLTDIQGSNAILYVWQPGTEGGNAIARVLYGEANPSAKLSMTFPRSVGQCPIYYNHYRTGRPKPDDAQLETRYISAYIDERNTPLYPFGYGLSYTKFEISDLKVSNKQIGKGESITASVRVANVGERAGEEVVQLYIHDKVASVVRPVKELKGFKKIRLEAGESKEVCFEISERALEFYNAQGKLVAEPGEFDIMIGNSSDNLLSTLIEYK